MKVRRVVAGTDAQGKSVFFSDDVAPNGHDFEFVPGQAWARIWYAAGGAATGMPATEPTTSSGPLLPPPGGSSFMIVQHAPAAAVDDPRFDGEKAATELAAFAPDLAAAMEADNPGMHRTPSTVDYVIVLDGEIWLELDGGEERRLTCGDTVVQLGGRHAWRNKSDRPATVAFVLTDARA